MLIKKSKLITITVILIINNSCLHVCVCTCVSGYVCVTVYVSDRQTHIHRGAETEMERFSFTTKFI